MVCTRMQKFRALQNVDICKKNILLFEFLKFYTRVVQQNLFYNFWTFLQVSMNFESLHYFLGIKTIEKRFKKLMHSAGPQFGPQPRPFGRGGLPRTAGQKAIGPRPGSPVQSWSGPRAAAWSPRAGRRSGALTGGK
jgi:hypothetical protein